MLKYLYDDSGIIGMVKDGASYYFHRNIQGDVVGVYANSTGTKVVTFKYDAFGRCTVSGNTTLAQWCKIRYRGYYFDNETGFYWVQTRYYNPEWCRWISPDSAESLMPQEISGINLYSYRGSPETSLKHQGREQKVLSHEHSVLTQKTINRNINQVANKHVEEVYRTAHLINSPIVRQLVGDVSYTISVASATPKGPYTFISRGNDGIKRGIGYSGNELYYTDDGAGFTVQLTDYFHVGAEASLSEGITFSMGADAGPASQDFSVSIGWGSALCYSLGTALVVAGGPISKAIGVFVVWLGTVI